MALATVGLLAGLGLSVYSAIKQGQAQKKSLQLQQEQADLANKRANLQAARSRRQAIREAIMARGASVNAAAGQGALDTSGFSGGVAQVQGTGLGNVGAINQTQNIGNRMYQLGQGITSANMQYSNAQTLGYIGSGLTSLTNSYISNRQTIDKITATT